jgi:hypothetical protein
VEFGAIYLLLNECAVLGEDGVGLGYRRDLFQGLFPQLFANLSKDATIAVTKQYATMNLLAENAIFRFQVRIAQPELLVNRCSDRPEQFFPVHSTIVPTKTSSIDEQYGRKRNEIQAEAHIIVEE